MTIPWKPDAQIRVSYLTLLLGCQEAANQPFNLLSSIDPTWDANNMELVWRMGMRIYLSSLCSTEQCRGVLVLRDAMPPRKWGSRVNSRGARSTAMEFDDTAETHIHRESMSFTELGSFWAFTRENRQEVAQVSSFFNSTYQFTYPFLLSGSRSLQRCSWGDKEGFGKQTGSVWKQNGSWGMFHCTATRTAAWERDGSLPFRLQFHWSLRSAATWNRLMLSWKWWR